MATQDNPADEVVGVLVTYVAEQAETSSGYWIDRHRGGVLVLAFTDDPAPHREAILARGPSEDDVAPGSPLASISDPRPLGQRSDVAIDVVKAEFSEAELAEVLEEVLRTPRAGSDTLFTCDSVPVSVSFPASAIADALPIAESDHPATKLMVDFVSQKPLDTREGQVPIQEDGWIVLSTAETPNPTTGDVYAIFGVLDDDGAIGATATARRPPRSRFWSGSGPTLVAS